MTPEDPAADRSVQVCIACGRSTEDTLLWEKNGSRVFRCRSCGLGGAAQGGFVPEAYYTAGFFNGCTQGGLPRLLEQRVCSERGIRRGRKAELAHHSRGTLIEIGAAYGFFLLEARAVLPGSWCRDCSGGGRVAQARGLDVRAGRLSREILEEIGPVDVAVMLDVIEHLEDPKATLALCSEFLRPGGIVVLTTPDFASALARMTGKAWRNMTPPQHLWYFTPESMARMATAVGLEVYRVSHPWKRVPVSLIVQLISRSWVSHCRVRLSHR